MATPEPQHVRKVARCFAIDGDPLRVIPLGSGHIHETWIGEWRTAGTDAQRFVHQRINRTVFRDPECLMRNQQRVIAHLREHILAEGGDPLRATLTLVPAHDGAPLVRDEHGECWRTYHFIEGARTFDRPQGPSHVRNVGFAFGRFLRRIADLPGPRLEETIPGFGDTRQRFDDLIAATGRNPAGADLAKRELRFAHDRERIAAWLPGLLSAATVPERIVHFDTKLNNVLIDDATGEAICVIDLDTVMPGTALYDFGDAARRAVCVADDDHVELAEVRLDLALFEQLARGFVEGADGLLVPAERERLADAARAVTFTIGVRFLTDFLDGDRYFRTSRPRQNLDRCKTQFELVRQLEVRADDLQRIVSSLSPPTDR